MVILITILHVIMCFVLIAIVLFQTGKGASMGAAFGGASNTIFGGAGPASFLNKITTIAAIVFMLTSFTLAIISSRGGSSSKVLDATPTEQTQPVEQTGTPPTEEQQDTSSEKTPVSENSQEEN
jgi:preprotein translocase subunit SecG